MAIIVESETGSTPSGGSKTLLNGVNEVLKRTQAISSQSELTSLTSSAKQPSVDIAIQVLNELVHQLYDEAKIPTPNGVGTSTITLIADDRDYELPSDLLRIRYPLIDQTNSDTIYEYPGGYSQLFSDQEEPSNYTGQPHLAAIRPTDGYLYLDRIPTSTEAGKTYTFLYDKELTLAEAGDTFPFRDTVFWALIPAAAQMVKSEMQNKFNGGLFKMSMGRAARLLTRTVPQSSWLPDRTVTVKGTDPYAN